MSWTPEFSRAALIGELGGMPREMRIEADAAERAAIAKRFALRALDALDAELSLVREGDRIVLSGNFAARGEQACVATGEAVPFAIDAPLRLLFLPELEPASGEEVELGEADCDIMLHDGRRVDAGEAVAQSLMLALDPYPRCAGAENALAEAGVMSEEEAGPMGALAGLKAKLEGR